MYLPSSQYQVEAEATGQYYYNSSTGVWESYDLTAESVFTFDYGVDDDGMGYGIYNFTEIPEHLAYNVAKGLPLNRSLTSYETKQETSHIDGMWTYVDIDIDSRLLSDGIYTVQAEFGYWNPVDYEFVNLSFIKRNQESHINIITI